MNEAVKELTTQWGYRDVTDLLRHTYEINEWSEFTYLCVLQAPDSGPVYCRDEKRLFKELDRARACGVHYATCPAPPAEDNLWMIVGNFELEDEE